MKSYFENLLSKSNIDISSEQIDKLLSFLRLLIEKNEVMNLTAIRDEKEIIEKHFIDSLLLKPLIKESDKNLIDIGTGAGFPGIVLAIIFTDKNFLLVDSVKKKISFIDEVISKLEIKNVKTSYMRAEELIKTNRESFDVGLCRGVANLRVIAEYLIPFLKVGGRFLAQKGNVNEVAESSQALKTLKSEIKEIHNFFLPESGQQRVIIAIIKKGKTDKKYPRETGIPAKNPL